VFSGASNKTTLQNTLRTGVYAMTYIRRAAEMALNDGAIDYHEAQRLKEVPDRDNYLKLDHFFISSGDDCVIWVKPRIAKY